MRADLWPRARCETGKGMNIVDHIMMVMNQAFDPEWGEAWNRVQLAEALILPNTEGHVIDKHGEELSAEAQKPAGFTLTRSAADEVELLLIAVVPELRGSGLGKALLDRLNLSAVADLPVDELTPSQQRLGDLAVALSQRPRLLIVDEPLAGLPSRDHPLIAAVLAALPRELSILIIEHHLDLAPRFAHSVAVYVNGVILAEGTSDEIRNDRDVGALFRGGSL